MTAPQGTTEGTPATDSTTSATDDANLGDAGKAALTAERAAKRAAERDLATLRAELQAIKDKDASATDVATRKATEAEARATAAEAKLLRLTIATEKGLPANLAARLQGATEDELRADADELLKLVGPAKTEPAKPKPTGKPRERLSGGGDPTGGDANALNGDPILAALHRKLGITSD
jgi:hypothetical protein